MVGILVLLIAAKQLSRRATTQHVKTLMKRMGIKAHQMRRNYSDNRDHL
jgi:hypothetical protein